MFSSYSPFHTHLFSRQPCDQCEAPAIRKDFVPYCEVADFFFISQPPAGRKEGTEYERIMYFCSPEDLEEEMHIDRKVGGSS